MTNKQHPITPPPKLVQQWYDSIPNNARNWQQQLVAQAAQWGADIELKACCDWLEQNDGRWEIRVSLRDARRPEPLNLKAQALQVLASAPGPDYPSVMTVLNADEHALIRQALEALPND